LNSVFCSALAKELKPIASEAESAVMERIFEKVCIEIPLLLFFKRDRQ
jgi:hypothetical protein